MVNTTNALLQVVKSSNDSAKSLMSPKKRKEPIAKVDSPPATPVANKKAKRAPRKIIAESPDNKSEITDRLKSKIDQYVTECLSYYTNKHSTVQYIPIIIPTLKTDKSHAVKA